jgi:hypothetical protein
LVLGWMSLSSLRKQTYKWEFVHLYGQYDMSEMNLYLTNQISHYFWRLSIWLSTRSICGLFFGRRSSAGTWILGATVAQDIYSRFGWRCDKRLTCWTFAYTCHVVFLDGWFIYLLYMIRKL